MTQRRSPWARVESHLAGLDGVRGGSDGRPWTVGGRLVARRVDGSTLLIRTGFDEREILLADHPDTFSVRPELEAHMKVLADLDAGDLDAVCAALTAAWELQRR
ncbi:hypothetical protein PZ938_15805 [Luteipulveratus sp. YIM 133132]|uniref:MmcQ/YjbR family DNA-binding protein n=1 Tax=Luteipulveratus flavus TaxID=3031728 RepID=A0ABT6C3E3_9MICO|nr:MULTISPECIES: hypothetical protein [unclassified Luteipulveratus]MDE9367082.1 hypothetical protein [Luteipulveratus sp. YIM 133132]MDF8263068.1 hypothetical protein [Luteipulveratus sp. YIM 133296]